MIIEGVLAVQAGENPRLISDRLMTFVPPDERGEADDDDGRRRPGAGGGRIAPWPGTARGSARGDDHDEHADERWLLTYADMITLLMALFIVMWSMAIGEHDEVRGALRVPARGVLREDPARRRGRHAARPDVRRPSRPRPSRRSRRSCRPSASRRATASAPTPPSKEAEDLEKLKREIDAVDARTTASRRRSRPTIARRGLVVRVLTDRVLFDSGSADIKPAADHAPGRFVQVAQDPGPQSDPGRRQHRQRSGQRTVPDQLGAVDDHGPPPSCET